MKILITGAASGIGAAIARRLAARNDLLLHYFTSESAAVALQKELSGSAASVTLCRADLSTPEGCEVLVATAKRHWDQLDCLVNNAGGMIRREGLGLLTWENTARTFAVNTYATMSVTSGLVDLLKRGTRPSVVNMASIAMRHGAPSATAYGAAKAAIDAFTRGAARELGPLVRVNCIAPGIIDTQFHERLSSKEQMATWQANTLLRRHGTPDDVADAVAFLIGNEFMTGECLDINGGLFTR